MPTTKPVEIGDDDHFVDGSNAVDAAAIDGTPSTDVNNNSTTSNANGDSAPQIKDTLKTLKLRRTRQSKSFAAASTNVVTAAAPMNSAPQVLPSLHLPTDDYGAAGGSQSAPVSAVPGTIDTQREGEEAQLDGGGGAEGGVAEEKYRFGGWSKDEHELFSKVDAVVAISRIVLDEPCTMRMLYQDAKVPECCCIYDFFIFDFGLRYFDELRLVG
jgi:hypothetical protein